MKRTFRIALQGAFLLGLGILFSSSQCGGNGTPPPVDAGLYHTYAEINKELHDLAAAHPQIARIQSIGKSVQNRDLWAIKISDNAAQDEEEATVAFLGGHHAREWIAVDVPFYLAKYLLENYASDTRVRNLVDNAEIWIVPMVNPDGHQYSVTSDRLWRKNRRNNGNGTYGVDLNRNYSHRWGGPGSSGDTWSETYRGTAPFSEPESQAVRDLLQNHPPRALITYHNYTQLVLYPWGNTYDPAPDQALMHQIAVAIADSIRAIHGKNYTPQQASDLYLASGDTTDWLYALLSAPAFTVELRPRGNPPGFKLPESEIQPTFQENLPAALFLIEWAIQQSSMSL